MSVIFKTLKKLRAQSRESFEDKNKARKRRNVLSLYGMLTSPKTVLFLIGIIFLSGIAVFYGTDLLKERLRTVSPAGETEVTPAVKIQDTQNLQASAGREEAAAPEEATMVVPPPPDTIPVEERPDPGQESRGISMQSPRPEAAVTVRYHPSRREESQAVPSRVYRTEENKGALTEGNVTFPLSGMNGPETRENDRQPEEAAAVEKKTERAEDNGAESFHDVPALVKKPHNDIYRITSQKNTKIARLVRKIEKSIAQGRSNTVISNLLNRLAVLKGSEDTYVLKMRAFSKMRQGDFGSAQSLLQNVLKTHEDDLEAGINMAIIEIKSGRHGDAKERLLSLLGMHPHNTLIADMLLQLK